MTADVLRLVYPRHSAKLISRDFGVALRTAKHWLRFGYPRGRDAQVEAVIVARLLEQQDQIAQTIRLVRRGLDEASTAHVGVGARALGGRTELAGAMADQEGEG